MKSIAGFENVKFLHAGYAIEFSANAIETYLRNEVSGSLYFAGQINGTTGYEEAASQVMAGINAFESHEKKPILI
jgi:tRNA uridine 5-carboxymethylaminomethyl modification enzyme